MHDREIIIWYSKDEAINEHNSPSSRNRGVILGMDGIFDSVLKELKLVNKQFCGADGDAKIIKMESTHGDAKNSGNGSTNFSVTPRGKENF